MRVIPAIDVMGGRVVRAVAGRRDRYRPIRSRLTPSTDPLDVARAMLAATGAGELYVADLDALTGQPRVAEFVEELLGVARRPVWLDAGLDERKGDDTLPDSPWLNPVVGTETASWSVLANMAAGRFAGRVGLSIDLRAGELLGDPELWNLRDSRDLLGLARQAVAIGVGTLIVLDLVRVGTGTGTGTEELCLAIRKEWPAVRLYAGGGVRDWGDVRRLAEAGADGVLVASALHDGKLAAT